MQTLNHDQKFIINGLKCTLCTLKGFAAKDGLTVEEFYEMYPLQRMNDNRPSGVQFGTMITSSKAYYEKEVKIWSNVITLQDGETVMIEGKEYKTKFKGNYSDAVVFIEV